MAIEFPEKGGAVGGETKRIVVVGGNAAGAKAASRAKRYDPSAEVILVDRGNYFSYGACGIPSLVAGRIAEAKDLLTTPAGVIRDRNYFRQVKGIDLRDETEAVEIHRANSTITLLHGRSGIMETIGYDRLILATGSTAAIPPIENLGCPSILTLKTLDDALRLRDKAIAGRAACIVGGGLIGLETADALKRRGMSVTVVEMREQLLPGILDRELAGLLERYLSQQGVTVLKCATVVGFDGGNRVERAITTQGNVPADLVILAPGVVPNVTLAEAAGIALGPTGAIAVNPQMQTSDPNIFACGDCCEVHHILTAQPHYLPLGSTANKQGRVAGTNAAGGCETFDGILGTIILRVFDFTMGRTGLSEEEAVAAGHSVVTSLVPASDRAHFLSESRIITLKLIADSKSGRVLGVQGVGHGVVDKRIDTAAAFITMGGNINQLAGLDLAYAPPYSTAIDPLQSAAHIINEKRRGRTKSISAEEVVRRLDSGEELLILDVRTPEEHAEEWIDGSRLLPLAQLRQKLASLPRQIPIITFCKTSLRGYEAEQILTAA
ncbi:MAG TPA: FAD-dependent oxidoreductase, partial [Geobacterales bacterium]|nr:FAD-dependent oxidoreductase [Geobacterales bacterium]